MKKWKRYVCFLLILCICAGCKSQQEDDVTNNPVNEKDNTKDNKKEDAPVNEQNPDLQIKEEEVEAVFYNSVMTIRLPTASGMGEDKEYFRAKGSMYIHYGGDYNQIVCPYNVEEHDKQLFAFAVVPGHYVGEEEVNWPEEEDYKNQEEYRTAKGYFDYYFLVDSLKDTGIKVVKNYPYSYQGLYCSIPLKEYEFYYCGENDSSVFTIVGTIDEIKEVFAEGKPVEGRYYRLFAATRPDAVQIAKEQGMKDDITMLNFQKIFGEENQVTVKVCVE